MIAFGATATAVLTFGSVASASNSAVADTTPAGHASSTNSSLMLHTGTARPSVPNAWKRPTVVLVHGAFADASGWDGVIERLQRDGYPVIAAANPLEGLAPDSAAVRNLLASIKGPIILVGHSYGGAVITDAATGNPNVKALVYIAALAPDTGESPAELLGRPVAHPIPPLPLVTVSSVNPDGTVSVSLYLDRAKFRQVFAGDVSPRLAADMDATQRPVAAAGFTGVSGPAAWHSIPSWYLVAKQDHVIAPDLERFMAKRIHAHTVQINSSHVAMISHPAAVTNLIEDAARSTR